MFATFGKRKNISTPLQVIFSITHWLYTYVLMCYPQAAGLTVFGCGDFKAFGVGLTVFGCGDFKAFGAGG